MPSRWTIGRRPIRSLAEGSREQILEAYRALRDDLVARIKARFALTGAGGEALRNSDVRK